MVGLAGPCLVFSTIAAHLGTSLLHVSLLQEVSGQTIFDLTKWQEYHSLSCASWRFISLPHPSIPPNSVTF